MAITKEALDELIKTDVKTFTKEYIEDLFTDHYSDGKIVKSKYEFTERVRLEKGQYFNTENIETSLGRIVFNKVIIETNLQKVTGYVNYPISKDGLADMEQQIAQALQDDIITGEIYAKYLSDIQWFSGSLNYAVTVSYTERVLKPEPEIIKERDKLLAKHKDAIAEGDVSTAVKIEEQLIKLAKAKLDDDIGMDLYKSGARGSFENNYKNCNIMKGPVFNPVEGKFEILERNYMEGMTKQHIAVQGNAIVAGAFPKAINKIVA